MVEIRAALLEDTELQAIEPDSERAAELKEALREKRAIREVGMRASHKAAGLDVHHSIQRIYNEVRMLYFTAFQTDRHRC